jgi:hypothetical protein
MQNWIQEFIRIHEKIIQRKDSEVFREPVQYEALNIPDYPQIVKHPMDLRTVKEKLDQGRYLNYQEAAHDMRLIWFNAMLYNAPGSKIYQYAKALSEYYEKLSSLCFPDDPERLPTNEEASTWVDLCHRITPEEMGKLLRMIDESCPNCLVKRSDVNEVEVNVDLIPGKLFRQLYEWTQRKLPDLAYLRRKTSASLGHSSQSTDPHSVPSKRSSNDRDSLPSKKMSSDPLMKKMKDDVRPRPPHSSFHESGSSSHGHGRPAGMVRSDPLLQPIKKRIGPPT